MGFFNRKQASISGSGNWRGRGAPATGSHVGLSHTRHSKQGKSLVVLMMIKVGTRVLVKVQAGRAGEAVGDAVGAGDEEQAAAAAVHVRVQPVQVPRAVVA